MENQLLPQKNEDFQIFEFLNRYIRYWPWFVMSVALCCALAFIWIKATPKTYQCTATMLIVEEDFSDLSSGFTERNQFKAKANVNNEIDMFMSPQLIQEVVKRLNLNISYAEKGWFKDIDLYTQSPVIAAFPDSYEQDDLSFQVELKPDSVVVLSNFAKRNGVFTQSIATKFNVPAQSPVGSIVISPSLYYTPGSSYQKPVVVSRISVKSASAGFAGALNVSLLSKEKTIISLSMDDASYQKAEDFLNALIIVYNENGLKNKNKNVEATLKQIDERLPIIEEELQLLDVLYATYKTTNRLTDTRDAASLYMKEFSEYTGKIIELNSQMVIATSIRSQINDNSKASESLPDIALNDPAIEASISEYNSLLFKRNDLIANGGERNPLIEDLNNNLNALRRSILHNVDNLIRTLRIRLSSLQSQESTLAANIASKPVQEKDLISIERELKIKEQLYLYLLQQREENEMARIVTATNSQVINPPSGNGVPVKPSKMKIMLVAFIIGAGIPFGVITGKRELKAVVRSKNDIARLPVLSLGIIPQVNKKELKKKSLFVNERGRDAINESFRMVRTNLELACMQDMKVIQITSMEPGAGKTFISLNLAMSLALTGKKTVLLDLDLRTAALSKLIEYQDMGLSITLSKINMEEHFHIEKDYFHPGFDIIPAGPVPNNASDLLTSSHLKTLIERLRSSYDYVLIDAMHVGQVADAVIVGQVADLSIFILRENCTDKSKITELANIYSEGTFKNMRVILNASSDRQFSETAMQQYLM